MHLHSVLQLMPLEFRNREKNSLGKGRVQWTASMHTWALLLQVVWFGKITLTPQDQKCCFCDHVACLLLCRGTTNTINCCFFSPSSLLAAVAEGLPPGILLPLRRHRFHRAPPQRSAAQRVSDPDSDSGWQPQGSCPCWRGPKQRCRAAGEGGRQALDRRRVPCLAGGTPLLSSPTHLLC